MRPSTQADSWPRSDGTRHTVIDSEPTGVITDEDPASGDER